MIKIGSEHWWRKRERGKIWGSREKERCKRDSEAGEPPQSRPFSFGPTILWTRKKSVAKNVQQKSWRWIIWLTKSTPILIQEHAHHFEPMERGRHCLDHSILDHPRHLHSREHPGAVDSIGPSKDVEYNQLLFGEPRHRRPRHGRVQLHTRVMFSQNHLYFYSELLKTLSLEFWLFSPNIRFITMRDGEWIFGSIFCRVNMFTNCVTVSFHLTDFAKRTLSGERLRVHFASDDGWALPSHHDPAGAPELSHNPLDRDRACVELQRHSRFAVSICIKHLCTGGVPLSRETFYNHHHHHHHHHNRHNLHHHHDHRRGAIPLIVTTVYSSGQMEFREGPRGTMGNTQKHLFTISLQYLLYFPATIGCC